MKGLKIGLFIFLFLLLWLPLFQEFTKYFKEPQLTGAFVNPSKPTFSNQAFQSLEFQKQLEDYENSSFGFRAFFVKLRNSVDNILFHDLSVADNIEGENGFIFSLGSVENTLGINRIKKEKLDSTIEKISFFKKGIEKHGGHFLVVIAPSKEKIFPDFLPRRYINKYTTPNNYTNFVEGYKKAGIPFIDFCPYFKTLQGTKKFPVFTKAGFHWSMYAASFAQDSILSYIEKNLGKPIPKYKRIGVELSDKARESDADFENSLNLFFSVSKDQYTYPKLKMISATEKNYRPKIIIIGDSYFWQIVGQGMLKHVFSEDSKFWFYFATTSYSLDKGSVPLEKNEALVKELESADYVILFSNLSTLPNFPYGITDFYYSGGVGNPEIMKSLTEFIKSQPKWIDSLEAQKQSKHTSLETEIILEIKSILSNKKTIQLKAANNKFLCAGGENEDLVLPTRDVAANWETFQLLNLKNNQVVIQSYKQKFISAELNGKAEITNNRVGIGSWEIFQLISLPDNYVAFKAANGKYLSLDEKTGWISAGSNVIGKLERFKLTNIQ